MRLRLMALVGALMMMLGACGSSDPDAAVCKAWDQAERSFESALRGHDSDITGAKSRYVAEIDRLSDKAVNSSINGGLALIVQAWSSTTDSQDDIIQAMAVGQVTAGNACKDLGVSVKQATAK